MLQVYKFQSILPVVVLIITAQLPPPATSNIIQDITAAGEKVKQWVWGPPGTIAVLGTNKTSGESTPTVDMQPQWGVMSLSFPLQGIEGVLVKANPPDGCYNLEDPPKQLTPAEKALEEEDSSNSSIISSNNWFLLVEDGYCDYDTKIRNADWAGYTVLIIRKSEAAPEDDQVNATVIDEESKSINIYSCIVTDTDGLTLEHYAYPMPYTARIQDLRKQQWVHASISITGMSLGSVAAVAVVAGGAVLIVKQINKKKDVPTEAAKIEDLKVKVAKNLPSDKWRADPTNMRIRCKWCHKTFDHDEDVTTLLCGHQFHKTCLTPRILDGHAYCPMCRSEIHSAPTPEQESIANSTEKTPLLQSSKESSTESIREGKIVTYTDGRKPRYHCYICEILGLPLKDELEIVEQLSHASQSPSLQSSVSLQQPSFLHQQLHAHSSHHPPTVTSPAMDSFQDIEVVGNEEEVGEALIDDEVALLTQQMVEKDT